MRRGLRSHNWRRRNRVVTLNETDLEVFASTIAVGYAARDNVSPSVGFEFPLGYVMVLVKKLADTSDTFASLGQKVLAEAVHVSRTQGDKSSELPPLSTTSTPPTSPPSPTS